MTIKEFQGAYRFLSNFWPCRVQVQGVTYPSVEHAYQACKTLDLAQRTAFVSCTAGQAKRLGKSVTLRPDFEHIKLDMMLRMLRMKFTPGSLLARQLLATGEELLAEGNSWGDQFWGTDLHSGQGQNHLGRLLMQVRRELRVRASAERCTLEAVRREIRQAEHETPTETEARHEEEEDSRAEEEAGRPELAGQGHPSWL